jgi:methionine aminopeptidase
VTWRSDLGAHVDGYVALVATTVVIGETEVTGKKADAIQAAKVASDAIIRLLQPGKKNSELTPLIEKVRRRARSHRSAQAAEMHSGLSSR